MARSLLVLVVVLIVTAGCAQPIAGVAQADAAVVAQLTTERGCRAAGDTLIATVQTMLQRVDTGGFKAGSIDAVIAEIPVTELGLNMGRQCGLELIGAEYSRVLTTVNAMQPATVLGRMAQQGALSGMCGVDGTPIVLDQQARLACAGR